MSLPQAAPGHVSDTDTGGPATDRTGHTSPGSNVSSTVSTTGRRYLEWDYGSDLGLQYHTQGEAAMSLSQLEKLAISNYQEYLGEERRAETRTAPRLRVMAARPRAIRWRRNSASLRTV